MGIRPHLLRVVPIVLGTPALSFEHIVAELEQLPELLPGDGDNTDSAMHTLMGEAVTELPMGDPWIAAYLKFKRALLRREFSTDAEVEVYARETQAGLPCPTPSIPAAMFITADIDITFPESFPALMAALWRPHDSSRP